MSLKHEYTLNSISALAFHQRESGELLVLAGEGPYLKVFNAEKSSLICQAEVFQGQTVHGITVHDNDESGDGLQVAIWGGYHLILLTKNQLEKILERIVTSIVDQAVLSSDWILDAAISPTADSCVLVTAHNTVLRASIIDEEVQLEDLSSPSRSILYSAHLIWESGSHVLVAAGTVFGEIIVWKCSVSSKKSDNQTLFTFTGHEGSIFGVNISSPILQADGSLGRLLASCSDDRTIRVWDLNKGPSKEAAAITSLPVRETGFGESQGTDANTNSDKSLATVMGHASRIWKVKFLVSNQTENRSPSISILSFGEDATAQHWRLDLGLEPSSETPSSRAATLTNVNIFSFHSGKHIWSAACKISSEGVATVATGGADGKISLYNLENTSISGISPGAENFTNKTTTNSEVIPPKVADEFSSFDLESVLESIPELQSGHEAPPEPAKPVLETPDDDTPSESKPVPKKKKKAKKVQKDAFNKYAFVSENQFLATTTFGRILLATIGDETTWKEVCLPLSGIDDLRSYSLLKSIPEYGMAVLASSNGNIYGYKLGGSPYLIGRVGGKVADIFIFLNPQSRIVEVLATVLGNRSAKIFNAEQMYQDNEDSHITYTLPEKFIVTSAGRGQNFLILGSRHGCIAIYDPQCPEAPLSQWQPETFSPDAITTILNLPIPDPAQERKTSYFLTISRDGQYTIFCCTTTYNASDQLTNITLSPVHQGSPPFGPLIESAWFDQQTQNLLLYGFKSSNFIIFNATTQTILTSITCGGAHRSFAYSPLPNTLGTGHFIYTKASLLHISSQYTSSHTTLKPGSHGREIKSCAVNTSQTLIATGAEDTTIRISEYSHSPFPLQNNFFNRAVIQKHTTGIQALKFHGENYLFSSGGNEEFFVWKISWPPGFKIGVFCEASNPDFSVERDLRIIGFDVGDLVGGDGKMVISLAYSDSTIKVYTYSKDDGFELLAKGRYTASCLTQIRYLSISEREIKFLTTATDGRVAIWKLSLPLTSIDTSTSLSSSSPTSKSPQLTLKSHTIHPIHQNSIKSLDLLIFDTFTAVITGGDDNALALTVFPTLKHPVVDSEEGELRTWILRDSHAGAVTGLAILPSNSTFSEKEEKKIRVITSSNDQRVKFWEFAITTCSSSNAKGRFDVQIKKVADEFTGVADVGDLVFLRGRGEEDQGEEIGELVLVVGNGGDVWEVR